jgi:molybdate-binding protein/DNA-binding transcriptional regulator YhcF (GntR family)
MPYLYQDIAESIRRKIAAGELEPGDRLPAVRELAQQWNCTPGTVNRAYLLLAEEGIVGGYRGSGTRVLESSSSKDYTGIEWANLVNRAEQYLLEALGRSHTVEEAQSALVVAISRWQSLQKRSSAENNKTLSAKPVRFAGSHDLAIEILAHKLSVSDPEFQLSLEFIGSLGGLIALASDAADIAGVHLWDSTTEAYNLPYIRRVLPTQRLALVTLVHRKLGFIVPEGNPQGIESISDLRRPDVHWINRQMGSGTRIWFDQQLERSEIQSTQINGYNKEGATHMAVARVIRSGQATAGIGIQAAARAYGLNFIPLTNEVYQLVISETIWENPICQDLQLIIHSDDFRKSVEGLGGYDTSATGETIWI